VSNDPTKPVPGEMHIDASDVVVVDFTPDQIAKLVKFRDGSDKAMANVVRLRIEEIKRAGLNPEEVQRCVTFIGEYQRTQELLPSAEKMVELLYETQLDRAHKISQLFGEICAQARRRAERSPDGAHILGPLQDLFDYQFGPAQKASATREKAKASPPPPPAAPAGAPE
jgi:hypothetical protein